MTNELERQIEELRAELRNAVDPGERRQIAAELDLSQAELDVGDCRTGRPRRCRATVVRSGVKLRRVQYALSQISC